MEYKSNLNVVYSCKYHVVWCPKYRRKVLTDEIATRLKELIIETDVPHIVARGRKGGSNVAASIVNALLYSLDPARGS